MPSNLKERVLKKLLPLPVTAEGWRYSMIFTAHDDPGQPSPFLINIAIEATRKAQEISLGDIGSRLKSPPFYPDIWPGEHYKLLAGLTLLIKPKLVIEVGTGGGLAVLAIKKYLTPDAKIITFDLIDWKSNPQTYLKNEDFADGRLIQSLDDLADINMVNKHRLMLEAADIIFFDAAKDGIMEQKFIDNFRSVSFKTKPLVIFDDIRVWNMLKIWRDLPYPKLDITSFGHWSGTGLVEWPRSSLSLNPTPKS